MKHLFFAFLAILFFAGCHTERSTADLPAVRNFDAGRYCGVWYEIARLPHSFQKGMTQVKATYTLRDDGTLSVRNEGVKNGKAESIDGVARFKGEKDVGELEVSFFRPFYGDYKIIALDENYTLAVVTSSTRAYFWILSRTPSIAESLRSEILERARADGFDIGKIIFAEP